MTNTTNDREIGNAEPTKPSGRLLLLLLALVVAYVAGVKTGASGYSFEPKEFRIINRANQPKTVDYQLLWDAVSAVNESYIEGPLDPQKVLYGAVRGAVKSSGDPYTDFFEPSELKEFREDLKGTFEGIGAEIGKRNGQIVIVAPLSGSPAERAGLKARDAVLKVDGQIVADWSVDEAVTKIRGPRGSEVTLTVYRTGKDLPFDVKIVREKIQVQSVRWELKEIESGGQKRRVALVTLSRFGDDTRQAFDRAVNELLTKSVDGIVLDLRNNPGGYLQTAVDVASAWLEPGTLVVTEEKRQGDPIRYLAKGNSRLKTVPTVVLINGGSASAAEILAGALRDHRAATLVGEKSFGKGSVQELINLSGDSAVKVTVARWITPSGKNLNRDGLSPDVEVSYEQADVDADRDPQLDEAFKHLTN